MTVSEEMVLAGALAVRKWRMELNGIGHEFDPTIPPSVQQLDLTRACLTAALSDQVVAPKEPTQGMLDNAFINGPLGMTGLDGSEAAKRERATVAEIYKAMIAAAPASRPSPRGGE